MTFGLPPTETLRDYRIWDSYFTPAFSHPGTDGTRDLIKDIERSMTAIQLGHFEKLCYFAHVGIGTCLDALTTCDHSQPQSFYKRDRTFNSPL